MAWNGSDQTASGAPRSRGRISPKCAAPVDANFCSRPVDAGPCPRRKNTNPTALHLLSRPTFYLALLLLALAGAAVWYFFLRPVDAVSRPRPEKPKKSAPITAVTPAPAHTNRVVKPEQPKKVEPKREWWDVDKEKTKNFSEVEMRVWRFHHGPPSCYTAYAKNRPRSESAIFEHYSENLIAAYLTVKPGQGMIGTPNFKSLDADFLESCETPIVPSADDAPEVAALKRTMNEAKIEIRARMAAGETLSDILMESHAEVVRLAQLRQMLKEEIDSQTDENSTKESVQDIVTAANMILEEKGIAPLSANPIIRHKLMLDLEDGADTKAAGATAGSEK